MSDKEETIVGRRQTVKQGVVDDDTPARELIDQCLTESVLTMQRAILLSTATLCATLLETEVKFSVSVEAGLEECLKSFIRSYERYTK